MNSTCAWRPLVRLAAFLVLLLAAAAGRAQPQPPIFGKPVPSQWGAPPVGGVPLSFRSAQGESAISVPAMLYRPEGSVRGAVVVVTSATGWSNVREGHYGRSLSSAGYAVLLIDTHGARQVSGTQHDNGKLSLQAEGRDASAAKAYLVANGFAPERVAVMGTGRGGTVALLAADRAFAHDEQDRFALAIAITPLCIIQPREPRPAAKVFMALGDKDDVSSPSQCQSLADAYAAAGARMTVKTYPNASSGFDGHPVLVQSERDPLVETFANCKVISEPDGRLSYNGKSFDESEFGALILAMRKTCIKRGGAVWTNLTQKANLTLDVIDFLDASFRR